jgi:hypothetical protein
VPAVRYIRAHVCECLRAAVADSRSAPPCRVARRTQPCRVCASHVYRSAHEVSSPRSMPT